MALEELEALVKQLQTEVNTLKDSVATLTDQVSKEFLQKLQDVKINDQSSPLTFGDILQYGSDGKWHNVQPSTLGIKQNDQNLEGCSLKNLSDVLIISPSDNQFLVYDSTNNRWVNRTIELNKDINLSNYLTLAIADERYLQTKGGTIKWLTVDGETQINQNLLVKGGITFYNE